MIQKLAQTTPIFEFDLVFCFFIYTNAKFCDRFFNVLDGILPNAF